MEFKFIPTECKGDDKKFEGHFIIKALPYPQRLKMTREMGLKFKDGEAVIGDSGLEFADKLAELSMPYILEAKIKRLEDGYEFNGLEEVLLSSDCSGMIGEACSQVLNGITLGKN